MYYELYFAFPGSLKLHSSTVFVVTVLYRDNVEWDSEQEQAAQQKVNENSNIKVGEDQQGIE